MRRHENGRTGSCRTHTQLRNAHQLNAWFNRHNPTPGNMRGVPALDTVHQIHQRFRDH
ncbi:hypothetical protein [Pseudarthrobacter sp. MDT3-1]